MTIDLIQSCALSNRGCPLDTLLAETVEHARMQSCMLSRRASGVPQTFHTGGPNFYCMQQPLTWTLLDVAESFEPASAMTTKLRVCDLVPGYRPVLSPECP